MTAVALLAQGAAVAAPSTADEAAHAFFAAVRARRYAQAYGFLSASVQRQVAYADFAARSDDIRAFRVLALTATERHPTLVRYYVKGRLKLRHEGSLYAATYAGRAVLTKWKGQWRVEEVELKPLSQKRIAPDYRI